MAYLNVKITDLTQVQDLRNDDLLLVSHPLLNSEGALQETPYTSNSISGGALSGTIKEALRNDNMQIEGDWHFHTNQDNLPTQDFKLDVSRFVSALNNVNELNGLVNDGSGWYCELSTSFVQKEENRSGESQSLSVMNNVVPNIDFVQRVVAAAYQKLMSNMTNGSFIPSHIGQIIYSTRLSTENAVRAVYGDGQQRNGIQYPNTHWIQHSGYILSGASSGVSYSTQSTSNNKKDGGSMTTSISLAVKNLPAHSHNLGNNAKLGSKISSTTKFLTSASSGGTSRCVRTNTYSFKSGDGDNVINKISTSSSNVSSSISFSNDGVTSKTNETGSGTALTVNTFPPVKRVYIWERIS